MRHGDRHGEREREPSGMDGRVAETFVILRIFSPQLSFPDIYIYKVVEVADNSKVVGRNVRFQWALKWRERERER